MGLMQRGEQIFTFVLRQDLHDSGIKTILGNDGNFDGDDVCGILTGNEKTAELITSKLWTWFAYENPEPAIVRRLTKAYFDGGMEIKKILLAIVESNRFYARHLHATRLGPIALQALASGAIPRAALLPARGADQMMERQGMKLLFPPDVAGWDWGRAWINSVMMIERIKVADSLFWGPR